ncbi:conserved hypothetical protein [Mesorhizobium plurifarium]|uniref:Uncharacterized protein n=1 Tax=Mesorhizobium plurifarium TaxID=69974 RepID=A0A090DGI7_MESPL|nr:conserved hypothetical protein [Mesorhizobium plurifarium]
MALKTGVAKAIEGLRNHFRQNRFEIAEKPDGSAFVIIDDVPLGPPYRQENSWIGFYLSTACPDDDTYPFFVRGDLERLDGQPLKTPLHRDQVFPSETGTPIERRSAVMVSRRQNNRSSWVHETPLLKLLTVIEWMLKQ